MRRQLAEEDESAAKEGVLSLHELTPASMLVELLDIEDQQYVPLTAMSIEETTWINAKRKHHDLGLENWWFECRSTST